MKGKRKMLFSQGFRLFFKNIKFNFIIVVQLSISIVIAGALYGYYSYCKDTLNMFDSVNNEKIIFYMPDSLIEYENERREMEIEKLNGKATVEYLGITVGVDDSGKEYIILGYGDNMAKNFPLTVADGQWIGDRKEDEVLSCVLFEKGKTPIGTNLNIRLHGRNEELSRKFETIVCGKLKDTIAVPDFVQASNRLTADMLYTRIDEKDLVIPILICKMGSMEEYFSPCSENRIIFFDENIDNEVMQQYANSMKNEAWTCSYNEVIENSKGENTLFLSSYIPFFYCFLLMGLAGVLCAILLNSYFNKRYFSVCILCGMDKNNTFVLNFISNGITYCMFLMFIALWVKVFEKWDFIVSVLPIAVGIAFVAIIFIVISRIPFYLIQKSTNFIEFLSDN